MNRFNHTYARIIFLFFLLYGLATHAYNKKHTFFQEQCDLHFSSGITLKNIPVARSMQAQTKGLSHRSNAGVGMLFMWDVAAPRVFWMHETHMPLMIAFFDAKGRLFASTNMLPNTETLHYSVMPAKYALELSPDDFQKNHLSTGQKLEGLNCNDTTF